ncbi:MAG: hypothetical protein GXO69_10885 [Acidobacteria bacterium]|nr:hypothetical protein [Acidobacteriota bacterium]
MVIVILFLLGLSLRHGKQPESSGNEKRIHPYPLLWTWVLVTYFVPFLLSFVEAPMLIPRVTIITLPAIVLLITGLVRNLRIGEVMIISLITMLALTGTLISGDRYYSRNWKEDWRSTVQYVIHSDPKASKPVLAHWDYNFHAYFKMLGDNRKIIRPHRGSFLKLVVRTSANLGFYVLKAHDMHEIDPQVHKFFEKFFLPVTDIKFHKSECVYFHFRSLAAKAELIGGVPLPEDGKLALTRFNGRFKPLPKGGIRLCSNGAVSSPPFVFPAGTYRIRVLARGNRVKGETAQFQLSVGQHIVIRAFTKEKPDYFTGKLTLKAGDVLPLTITFLNDYFEKIKPDTPLDPGPAIRFREGNWDGTFTRKGNTRSYSARWVQRGSGKTVSDTVTIRKFTPAKIIMYRKSLKGCYRGKLSSDGTFSTGTADWYTWNGRWKARFPKMKFTGKLDRNLDILKIQIEKIQ